jgi:hypothetical protein
MYARVARFTGGNRAEIEKNVEGIRGRAESGPPEGVDATGFKLLADPENGVVVAIGFFETEEKMRAADAVLNEMSPPEGSMGTRASVDFCEVAVELDA